MHNASTAQEVTIISPSATNFQFRVRICSSTVVMHLLVPYCVFVQRWNDPSPMQDDEILGKEEGHSGTVSFTNSARKDTYGARTANPNAMPYPLPAQSIRTLLILDRFSINCHILYCSNDSLLATAAVMGRSFYDFVAKKDEALVRSWVDVIKSWGVNESGQPSDGGFGFGRYTACPQGRDSRCVVLRAWLPRGRMGDSSRF
jgi:hypothetical protein